ncbi:hypothetical protein LTR10_021855 [Elasticomyces elasticus]|uniref:Uncharacterized protein n=1 Tax=Exophiala sideris TaxID=1016849 RepID=A0ABR0JFR7_9EURO|nr:hypothetical protein LTR10_021855 [Elasticomyces elasticus]KAK5025287.1 hypothetical protein LTS07_008138 [Exophiala sideris]KAK5029164.1 hypothetical protein LTR13_008701 [Exophiala sideris]KAK5063347.1 hypothetical protein LTR69_004053 [Exophiala sideris]KAK5179062.1 hypothetical protein LTR44_008551 [Eurotiomycetes sp. CCFEE 6388]
MPTILTPQGWVKVAAPAPRPKKRVKYDPARALKGPLSYFSCQPLPPSPSKQTIDRPQYPYDLDAPPEKMERQSKTPRQSRAVSAPHQEIQYIDEEDYLEQLGLQGRLTGSESSRSSRSVTPPPPPRSRVSHLPSRSQRHDDQHTTSQSAMSYTRHRPVDAAPRPTSAYHSPPRSNNYNNYSTPGSFERSPLPSNPRSISYAWYNATTPLNL